MGKGRFLNQKLGKRMSRKFDLLKSVLASHRATPREAPADPRLPKKGVSREEKSRASAKRQGWPPIARKAEGNGSQPRDRAILGLRGKVGPS